MKPAEMQRASQAWKDGANARLANQPRERPKNQPYRNYADWWLIGWDNKDMDLREASRVAPSSPAGG